MIVDVEVPNQGLTITEATLVEWRRQAGDQVEKGDVLFEIETDTVLAVDTVVRAPDTSHASHRNSLRRYMESNARVGFKIPVPVCKHPEGSLRVPGSDSAVETGVPQLLLGC